jgi:hypothetical protein
MQRINAAKMNKNIAQFMMYTCFYVIVFIEGCVFLKIYFLNNG